jgi:hypothetical protein
MKVLYTALLFVVFQTHANPITEDKYWGFEEFPVKSVGMCRVTEFPALEFHFRCRSQDDFDEARALLMKVRVLEFNGYTQDFRDLPEYISFWLKLRNPETPVIWRCVP